MWKNLEDIMLNDIHESQKGKYYMITSREVNSQNGGCKGMGKEGMRSCCLTGTEFQFYKRKSSGDWLCDSGNLLNTTEWYT